MTEVENVENVDPVDALVERARTELWQSTGPEALPRLQSFATWMGGQRKRLRWVRRVALAGAISWVLVFSFGAWMLRLFDGPAGWVALVLPVVVLLGAVRAAERLGYWRQALCRVLLLGMGMVGSSSALFQNATFDSQFGVVFGGAFGVILLPTVVVMGALLGGRGLTTARREARRTGFESILSLSLVMGLSDAVFLLFVGAVTASTVSVGPWPFVLPVLLGCAAFGLMRGRTWGLLLMALANLTEVVLILDGQLLSDAYLHGGAMFVLIVTATVQLLLPVPVYAAIFGPSGRWVESLQRLDGFLARVLAIIMVALLLVSAAV